MADAAPRPAHPPDRTTLGLAALLAADRALKDTKVSSEEQIVTSLLLAMAPTASGRKAA